MTYHLPPSPFFGYVDDVVINPINGIDNTYQIVGYLGRDVVFVYVMNPMMDGDRQIFHLTNNMDLVCQRRDNGLDWYTHNENVVSLIYIIPNFYTHPLDYACNETPNRTGRWRSLYLTIGRALHDAQPGEPAVISIGATGNAGCLVPTDEAVDPTHLRDVISAEERRHMLQDYGFPMVEGTTFEREIHGLDSRSVVDSQSLRREIANVFPGMKCQGCGECISHPDNLIHHLGNEETLNYMRFCKENEQAPTLYCCNCFKLVENNADLWNKYSDIFVAYKNTRDLARNLQKKIEVVDAQQARLTQELLKAHKEREEHAKRLEEEIEKLQLRNKILEINPVAQLLKERFTA